MSASQAAAAKGAVGAGMAAGAEELGLPLGSAVDVEVVAQLLRPMASARVAMALAWARRRLWMIPMGVSCPLRVSLRCAPREAFVSVGEAALAKVTL